MMANQEAKALQDPRDLQGRRQVTGNSAFGKISTTTWTLDCSRNVFSIKSQTKLVCACTGMATFASITAMTAADDGILPSTEPSAQFRMRLMAWSIWYMGMAPKRTCSALTILKECVRTSPRALSAWDSGSVIKLVTDLLTRTRVGTQCPGSMWKKYHPRRLKFR